MSNNIVKARNRAVQRTVAAATKMTREGENEAFIPEPAPTPESHSPEIPDSSQPVTNVAEGTSLVTIRASDLELVEEADQGSEEELLTPEEAKRRKDLDQNLKRRGGKLQEGKKCPECGSLVALMPRESKMYQVCTDQFREDPGCYWSQEYKESKAETGE